VESQKFCELHSVAGVFDHSKFDVLTEFVPEFLIFILFNNFFSTLFNSLLSIVDDLLSLVDLLFLIVIVVLVALISQTLDHIDGLTDELLAHNFNHFHLLKLLS